jgi:hypothetical protein
LAQRKLKKDENNTDKYFVCSTASYMKKGKQNELTKD